MPTKRMTPGEILKKFKKVYGDNAAAAALSSDKKTIRVYSFGDGEYYPRTFHRLKIEVNV